MNINIKVLKVSFLIFVIMILFSISGNKYKEGTDEIIQGKKITPQDLGLQVIKRKIDTKKMSQNQRDTIQIGLITPEDNFLDIAVLYKSRNTILIYRNEGNGFLSEFRIFPLGSNNAQRIELLKPDNLDMNPNQRGGLKILFSNGNEKILMNKELLTGKKDEEKIEESLPDLMTLPRNSVLNISYIEQWRTFRNANISSRIEAGDIDRDGRNEVIYTFWPLDGYWKPTRIVIFESLSENQYKIDWDSTFTSGGIFNLDFPLTDFDNDGNLEFMIRGRDVFGIFVLGFIECYGEGNYKFYSSTFDSQVPWCIDLQNSVTFNGKTAKGIWICYSFSSEPYETRYKLYQYNAKYSNSFNFNEIFPNGVAGGDWFTFSIAVGDFDNDGKDEILEGNNLWGTNAIDYWDSTGCSTNYGYEWKTIIPNAPICGRYLIGKDLDNDGIKEIIACGSGIGTGSIGVVKHIGFPGSNEWTTKWWDSTAIPTYPNRGIDSGTVDGKFSILYPVVEEIGGPYNNRALQHIIIYSQDNGCNFFKFIHSKKDTTAFVGAKLCDIDKDGKMDILSPVGFGMYGITTYFCLADFEQVEIVGITPINTEIPKGYKLYQNYPNPFNSTTKIKFEIKQEFRRQNSEVNLKIFDITGKEIATLVNEQLNPGTYEVTFDGSNLPSGIYFYQLRAGNFTDTKKLILLK